MGKDAEIWPSFADCHVTTNAQSHGRKYTPPSHLSLGHVTAPVGRHRKRKANACQCVCVCVYKREGKTHHDCSTNRFIFIAVAKCSFSRSNLTQNMLTTLHVQIPRPSITELLRWTGITVSALNTLTKPSLFVTIMKQTGKAIDAEHKAFPEAISNIGTEHDSYNYNLYRTKIHHTHTHTPSAFSSVLQQPMARNCVPTDQKIP